MKYITLLFLLLSFNLIYSQNKSSIENIAITYNNIFSTNSKNDVSCYRIPALLTAKNGDLIAAIDERVQSCNDLNKNEDINIIIRRSEDNGDNWSNIETVVDYPFGESASDPSMILDETTGEIFLFYNYMDLKKENGIFYLRVISSRDNGKTWGNKRDITSEISKPEWKNDFKFITSGRGIQTSSGKLVHTLVNLENNLHLFYSNNHGKTWSFINTPIPNADESKIVELVNGDWMINSRIKNKGYRYVHISSNQGESWVSRPEPSLIDPTCNASIIRYSSQKNGALKNRLLFSNANMKDKRENMTVRISYDEGKTWSNGKTIYAGESAYSTLTVLQNGEIGLLFEKDDHTKNEFVKFSLEWLTDGKDKLIK